MLEEEVVVNDGNQGSQTTPPAGVSAEVNDGLDEKGVSYKNRAMEYQRKLDSERKRSQELETQLEMERQKKSNVTENVTEEDEFTKEQRKIAREEYANALKMESLAKTESKRILDNLESEIPNIAKYRQEIENELSTLSHNLRINPITVRKLAYAVIGEYSSKKSEVDDKSKRRLQVDEENNVLPPTPKPSASTEIILTDEEREMADAHNLIEKGFDEKEIREFCEKRKKKNDKK